jgi:hypothetical protein
MQLLALLLSAAACHAMPLVQETFPPPTINSLLRAESTSMDLVRAQEALGMSDYQSAFWERTNTSPMFRIWDDEFRKDGKATHFMKEYMRPWGKLQSYECTTHSSGTCPRLHCDDLGDGKDRLFSAAAYQVILSLRM